MKNFDTQELRYPNIGTVYYCHIPEASSVRICVINNVGGMQDPDGLEGLAHFFEHTPFRGTKDLPTKLAISGQIERLGGHLHATTDLMETSFEVEIPTRAFQLGLQTLHQLMRRPLLSSEFVKAERGVIEAEIQEKENRMAYQDFMRIHTNLFGEAGRKHWVAGTKESLQHITPRHLREFHERYYRSETFTFIICGNLAVADVGAFLEESLAEWAIPQAPQKKTGTPLHHQIGVGESWESTGMNTKMPFLCFFAPAYLDTNTRSDQSMLEYTHKMDIVNDILFMRGMSAKLFQELRERRSLIYSLGGSLKHSTRNLGLWGISCALKNAKDVQTTREAIQSLLLNPKTYTMEDLKISKGALLGGLDLDVRSPLRVTRWIRHSLIFGEPLITVDEWRKRIQDTTHNELLDVVQKFFVPNQTWNWITFLPN